MMLFEEKEDKNAKINKWLIRGTLLTFFLILLDVGTTIYGFNNGFGEANPIVRAMMSEYGMLGFWLSFILVIIGLGITFMIAYKVRYRWYKIGWFSLLSLGIIGRTIVVAHNIYIMFLI